MGNRWANMGSLMGRFLTTNKFAKLSARQLIIEAYRATLLYTSEF